MAALRDGARRAVTSPWLIVGGLVAFVAAQYADALSIPFINDDYLFLDKTRGASFGSLWAFERLNFHWYRPWSRDLHFWALQRLFGQRELPFHLVNLALWVGVLASFWALARRLAGGRVAAIATAGMVSMAAWGVPLTWISCSQDLWMLLFGLLALHAWASGRRGWATLGLALALLSKETAAVLAPLLVIYEWRVGGRRPFDAILRAWPALAVTAVWALVHPVLGGRLWHPLAAPLEPGPHAQPWLALLRAASIVLNLDQTPNPERGWAAALSRGLAGALILGGLAATALAARARPDTGARHRVLEFAAAWGLLGWMPLLMPSLGWHAYYALFGTFGIWLVLGMALERRAAMAVLLVTALALLRPARADTPTLDWGSEWYQRRAAEFIRVMRLHLRNTHPDPLPYTRFYFVRVPSNVGFLAGDGPALRVWYRNPTLRGGYYTSYRPRPAGAPAGPDLFFRFDGAGGWIEVVPGPEDVAQARAANPRWEQDHATLASALAAGDNWRLAALEFVKLADAFPGQAGYAHDAGVCFETLGDSTAAARWYARAGALPDADNEARRAAERSGHHLRAPR